MIRHRPLALVATLVAGLALPVAPAAAATQLVRPASTTYQTWTTSPFGASLASVLDDAVVPPEQPSLSGDYAQVASAGTFDASVSLARPVLADGESPTTTRLVFYAQVGAATTLTATLWAGMTPVAWTVVSAGSPAGWYQTPAVPLTTAQLGALYGQLRAQVGSGFTPTRAYALAGEVDTQMAPPSDPGQAPAAGPTGQPAIGADEPLGGDAGDGRGAKATPGEAAVAAILPEVAAPLVLAPGGRVLPVAVGCPQIAADHCRGTIVVRAAGTPPRGRRARAARCARGCRVIGEGAFDVAAGKTRRVRVKMAKAARSLFAGRTSLRATLIVTTRGRHGRKSVTSHEVTLRRAG